jgi:hypothetical protein
VRLLCLPRDIDNEAGVLVPSCRKISNRECARRTRARRAVSPTFLPPFLQAVWLLHPAVCLSTHANTHTQCDTAPTGLQDLIATLTAELEVLQGVNARLLLSLGRVVSTWRSVVTENCRLKAEIAMHGPTR